MLFIIAFVSGLLTILTPCVLPMLPIILGASHEGVKNKIHSYTIIASLIISIFLFTIILRGTLGIFIDNSILQIIGGAIIGIYGLFLIFPKTWNKISQKLGLSKVGAGPKKEGILGDIILGASLGPIFTSCTPTYLLIVGLILPKDIQTGAIMLALYCIGFGLVLLLISHFGRAITMKLGMYASEDSIWKKLLGVLCIIIAILISTGYIKQFEKRLLSSGYDGFTSIEQSILQDFINNDKKDSKKEMKNKENIEANSTAYFAGGCFWCIEAIMDEQKGVKEAISGYAGGIKENATYEKVKTGNTKHREAVKVLYDSNKISYKELVNIFFHQIDPTDGYGQFIDRGFQYTPAIFYKTEEEKNIAENYIKELENSGKFKMSIKVKVLPYETFFEAEEYHQDYAIKNSNNYNKYKKGSGRETFIKQNWKNDLENTKNDRYVLYTKEELSKSEEKYNILFFESEWCTSCQAIKKVLLTNGIPKDIKIFEINFDSNLELRKKYNVIMQSTFVLVDKEGNLIKRWIPALGIEDLEEQVENATKSQKDTYFDEELRARLTPLQYKVTQEGYKEPAFKNSYWNNKESGIYVDIIDGTPLFSLTDKFDSGTGLPSFSKTIERNFIKEDNDFTLGMARTKISTSGAHLGHVFNDGPTELGGKRYCVNSAALKFIPKDQLKENGYEKYLELFE